MDVPLIQVSPGVRLIHPPEPPGQMCTNLVVVDGKVILDFGRSVHWVAFEPDQAEQFAREITDAVRTARALIVTG